MAKKFADDPHGILISSREEATLNENAQPLSDQDLMARMKRRKRREDEATADFIVDLAEVYRRRLHLEHGYGSITQYLVAGLGYSEDVAGIRTRVMNIAARHPRILALLRRGELHMSGICVLAAHLHKPGGEALIDQACGKTKRQIVELVAAFDPKPSVPTTIRRTPVQKASVQPAETLDLGPASSEHAPSEATAAQTTPTQTPSPALDVKPKRTAAPAPLGNERYKVTFTARAQLVDKLRRLEALLSHRIPRGDLPAALERAVDIAIDVIEKQRFGKRSTAAPSPRNAKQTKSKAPRSRKVPAAVRREVYDRDGGRCTYEGPDGRRCGSRHRLEFEHIMPFALGGSHRAENVVLLCRAHNQHQAVRQLGEGRVGPPRRS